MHYIRKALHPLLVCSATQNGNTDIVEQLCKKVRYIQPERATCSKSAAGLLPCCHQVDIRRRSHRLLRLDDKKFAASWQKVSCKLIVKILLQV